MFSLRITSRSYLYSIKPILSRGYTSKTSIGNKLESVDEIKKFINDNTWSLNDYFEITESNLKSSSLPSIEVVDKLLKLSGLPNDDKVDKLKIQKKLQEQLNFIRKVQEYKIDEEGIDPSHSRILPRKHKELTYDGLIKSIESQAPDPALGEIQDSWRPLSLAQETKDDYFVADDKYEHIN